MTNIIREGTGTGYTERDAMNNWLESDQFKNYGIGLGHAALDTSVPVISKCTTKPKIAKRAHVEHSKQVGTRKWRTMYMVSRISGSVGSFLTQAEAIASAKEQALHTKEKILVRAYKKMDGDSLVAEVTPGNSKPGEWHFSAEFKY